MLHLVNYPFSDAGEARRCLNRIAFQDHLLFIENGVFSVVKTSPSAHLIESSIDQFHGFVLKPDLNSRGIPVETLLSGIEPIGYSGFVELAAEFGPVQSWFR